MVYQGTYPIGEVDQFEVYPNVDYNRTGGRLTIDLKAAGSSSSPSIGNWTFAIAPADFALVADARVSTGSSAGFRITFGRGTDWTSFYNVVVNTSHNQAALFQDADGKETRLVNRLTSASPTRMAASTGSWSRRPC
jgi:hypothetical protein